VYCDGTPVANGTRSVCLPSRQILITLYGTQLSSGFYSYLQPLTIQILNNFDSQANYNAIELSSMALSNTIASFGLTVPDYYELNITLNSSVL